MRRGDLSGRKRAKFGRLKPADEDSAAESREDRNGNPIDPNQRDVWSICTVYSGSQEKREGVIIGICAESARVRFKSRSEFPPIVRIKSSRLGLNRLARLDWQSEFDAQFLFNKNSA